MNKTELRIIEIIKKQRKVYYKHLNDKDSKWYEGAYSTCNYIIQLIKEDAKLWLKQVGFGQVLQY